MGGQKLGMGSMGHFLHSFAVKDDREAGESWLGNGVKVFFCFSKIIIIIMDFARFFFSFKVSSNALFL